ncbi:MAG: 4-hydroxy-tetrahydrodipicolinate synthase [Oscillospiraceae bacterium]|nr:4-hydroxy-tetrahydrodipicolinate synthase [Oscillospiraceae bacterium]MDD6856639.1 4-hydroxy-tetrahydrodipicolinate synthase [Oscillospiraceae bacterium]
MKHPFFSGVCTALVTPFLKDTVNYPMLEQLLRRQYDAGIRALVICGTTGESATLTDEEKLTMFRYAKKSGPEDLRIIAGTGSNSTAHAIALSQAAQDAGADGLLVVSPYYNKATPEGLYLHYAAIASSVQIPVILYNVPSRTGVDIPVEVYRRLSKIPNIAGVKEASSDIRKIARIRSQCPDHFTVWCGNDDLAVAAMALGAKGLISVVSNIEPEITGSMIGAALDGDFDTATALQLSLLPLIDALFQEVNPIPVKAAMAMIGYDCGGCRMPLCGPSENTAALLKDLL